MLKGTDTETRKQRHDESQEDFTPEWISERMYNMLGMDESDFTKTIVDPSCGIGNLIDVVVKHRLPHCKSFGDIIRCMETVYGIEYYQDNIDELEERFIGTLKEFADENGIGYEQSDIDKLSEILSRNFNQGDTMEQNGGKIKALF